MSQPGGGVYTLPLDQYIGGVVLAEIGYNDNIETIKAFAKAFKRQFRQKTVNS